MRTAVCIVALATALVSGAGAQVFDLPVGPSANVAAAPQLSVDAGLITAGDFGFGARANYKVVDEAIVFAGIFVPDGGVSFGGGALYALPFELPVDLAVRAGLNYWSDSESFGGQSWDLSVLDISGLVVASGALDSMVEGLGWYASVGMHYFNLSWDEDIPGVDDSDMGIQIGGGATFAVMDNLQVFAGVDVLTGDWFDDVYVGGGVSYGLDI